MDRPPRLPPPGQGQLLTPPDSPRKRRRQLRESDDTDGFISIEAYLYRSDPYRSTTVSDPLPFPLLAGAVPQELSDTVQRHRSDIESIMTSQDLPTTFTLDVVRYSKPGYPGGHVPYNVARVIFDGQTTGSFGNAKDDLNHFLNRHHNYDLDVEIVDRTNAFQPSLFPIPPNHPTVVSYNAFIHELVKHVKAMLGSKWIMISLFLLGRYGSKSSPTIVIMVRPKAIHEWSDFLESVKRMRDQMFPMTCRPDLEIIPGGLFTSTPDDDDREAVGRDFCDDVMKTDPFLEMGTSIGITGEDGGGTLGGLFNLTRNNFTHKCLMTNYHVIRPAKTSDSDVALQANRFGSSYFGDRDATHSEVVQYSPRDSRATMEGLQTLMADYQNHLRPFIERREQAKMQDKDVHPRVEGSITRLEAVIKELRRKTAIVNAMPVVVGQVLCSSGKKVEEGRVHDWALVEVHDTASHLFGDNKVPPIGQHHSPRRYGQGGVKPAEGQLISATGKLEFGRWYLRVGRTSTNAGVCNGVFATCNWVGEDIYRYDSSGSSVTMENGATDEYLVLSKHNHGPLETQMEFGLAGDSGSLLIDQDGEFCGLYYGNCTSWVGPAGEQVLNVSAGVVMAMEDVEKAIEKKTTPRDSEGAPTGPPGQLTLPEPEPSTQ